MKMRAVTEVVAEFKCVDCDNRFTNAADLQRHNCEDYDHETASAGTTDNIAMQPKDTAADAFKAARVCSVCAKLFSSTGTMRRHVQQVHGIVAAPPVEDLHKCAHCDKLCASEHEKNEHELDAHQFVCNVCCRVFRRPPDLQAHRCQLDTDLTAIEAHNVPITSSLQALDDAALTLLRTSLFKQAEPLVCRWCKRTFVDIEQLGVHEQRVHLKERRFECPVCARRFLQKVHMQQHLKNIHFKNKSKIEKKKLMLSENKKVTSPAVLQAAPRTEVQPLQKVSTQPMSSYAHTCAQCEKAFKSSRNLRLHVESVHSEQRSYACVTCGATFKMLTNLNAHLKIHADAIVKCIACTYTCRSLQSLRKHEWQAHRLASNERVQCAHCDYVCANFDVELKQHARIAHALTIGAAADPSAIQPSEDECDVQPVQDGCDMPEKGKNQTTKCPTCAMSFTLKMNLQHHQHKFGHYGGGTNQCPHCATRLSNVTAYMRHLATVHAAQETKAFACTICTHRMASTQGLRRHMRTVHKQRRRR